MFKNEKVNALRSQLIYNSWYNKNSRIVGDYDV